jgi:hypothetical protein
MIKKEILIPVILFTALMLTSLTSACSPARETSGPAGDTGIKDPETVSETKTSDTGEDLSPAEDSEEGGFGLMDEDIRRYIDSLDLGADYFLELSRKDREYLIDLAHDAITGYLEGDAGEVSYPEEYDGIENEVHLVLRVDGRKTGWNFASSENLAESVVKAVINTLEDNNTELDKIKDNLWNMGIEIIIAGEEDELDEEFEPGIHGVRVHYDGKSAVALNTLALEGNISLESVMDSLYEELGADPESAEKYCFPVIHFAKIPFDEDVVSFYRCSDTELVPDVTAEKIFNSLELAKAWMLLNLDEDGYFNYGYSPASGEYFTTNNMVRQLLCSKWLAAESTVNENLKQLHRINLEYVLRNWYMQEGEMGYIYFGEKSKLGAMAMALGTIALSPLYKEYEGYAQKIANTILSMQHGDGSFDAWFVEPNYDYDEDSLLRFYSGEGILGIIDLYERSGEVKYLHAAELSQDFYIEKYVKNIEENYSPAYVPWQTICLNKLYKITGDRKYIEPIFILNDRLLKMQNQNGKPYPDFLGRFYDPEHPEYGPPNSGSTSPYVESLAYAYEIAEMEGDRERMAEYKKAIVLGIHNLMNLQFRGSDMYYLGHPERVEGALRYRMFDNRIRIDTTQHTIDALSKIIEVFELN